MRTMRETYSLVLGHRTRIGDSYMSTSHQVRGLGNIKNCFKSSNKTARWQPNR